MAYCAMRSSGTPGACSTAWLQWNDRLRLKARTSLLLALFAQALVPDVGSSDGVHAPPRSERRYASL
jgi:hypothetical protein